MVYRAMQSTDRPQHNEFPSILNRDRRATHAEHRDLGKLRKNLTPKTFHPVQRSIEKFKSHIYIRMSAFYLSDLIRANNDWWWWKWIHTCKIHEPLPENVYPEWIICLCLVKLLSILRMHWINVLYCGWINISVTRFSLAYWISLSPTIRTTIKTESVQN